MLEFVRIFSNKKIILTINKLKCVHVRTVCRRTCTVVFSCVRRLWAHDVGEMYGSRGFCYVRTRVLSCTKSSPGCTYVNIRSAGGGPRACALLVRVLLRV